MEANFPRGGANKPSTSAPNTKKPKRKKTQKGKAVRGKRNGISPKIPRVKTSQTNTTSALTIHPRVTPLSLPTVTEGMLVLGCVQKIHTYGLVISLPGRLRGQVPATAISTAYTDLLRVSPEVRNKLQLELKPLSELFYVGQHVVAQITQIFSDTTTEIELSLDPKDIHSQLTYKVLKAGMVLTGAVKSLEDYGYRIDVGIDSLNAFLADHDACLYTKEYNNSKPLSIGQLIRCKVHEPPESATSILSLSSRPTDLVEAIVPSSAGINPYLVIPGMKFETTKLQVFREGFRLKWQQFEGMLHEYYYPKPCMCLAFVETLKATVLYVTPLTRTVHFTMRTNPEPFSSSPNTLDKNGIPLNCPVKIGTKVEAEVTGANMQGVCVKFVNNFFGFIPTKYLHDDLNQIPKDMQGTYYKGRQVMCRIMHYSQMDAFFICTSQRSMLDEPFFSENDLKLGMKITGRVVHVRSESLILQIGCNRKFTALVPYTQTSDLLFFKNAKKQPLDQLFHVGQGVQGLVYKLNEEQQVEVTLRDTLIQSQEPILSALKDVVLHKWYLGTVVCSGPMFYTVVFFNNVKGILKLKHVPLEKETLAIGTIVRCRALFINRRDHTIELTMFANASEPTLIPGDCYSAKVKQVLENGIQVEIAIEELKVKGFVPTPLLSPHPSLNSTLHQKYSQDDEVQAMCLISHSHEPILTLDPFMMDHMGYYDPIQSLPAVRCIMMDSNSEGIIVRLCDRTQQLAFAPWELISSRSPDESNIFEKWQGLLCCMDRKWGTFHTSDPQIAELPIVTLKLSMVTKSDREWIERCLDLFEDFLKTVQDGNISCAGQLIDGTVVEVGENCAALELNNGFRGLLNKYHMQGHFLKVGEKMKCLVLHENHLLKTADVSIRGDVIKLVNHKQGTLQRPKVGAYLKGMVLLASRQFVLLVLKTKSCKGLLAYQPGRLCSNDFYPDSLNPEITAVGQVKFAFMARQWHGFPVCVDESGFRALDMPLITGIFSDKMIVRNKDSSYLSKPKHVKSSKFLPSGGNMPQKSMDSGSSNVRGSSLPCSKVKSKTANTSSKVSETSSSDSDMNSKSEEKSKKRKKSGSEDNTKVSKLGSTKRQAEDSASAGAKNKKTKVTQEDPSSSKACELTSTDETSDAEQSFTEMHEDNDVIDSEEDSDEPGQSEEGHAADVEDALDTTFEAIKFSTSEDEDEGPRSIVSDCLIWRSIYGPDDDIEDEVHDATHMTPREKKMETFINESELRDEEMSSLMHKKNLPDSVEDFERLLMAEPNSSLLWIQYMVYYMQEGDMPKARSVVRRGLDTISSHEEREKWNIWFAYLQMENNFGSKESMAEAINAAREEIDEYLLTMNLLDIYGKSRKAEEGEAVLERMRPMFRNRKDFAVQEARFYYLLGQPSKARTILESTFDSLITKSEKCYIYHHFAKLERSHGSLEKACELFDSYLKVNPRRSAIWYDYVKGLMNSGQMEKASSVIHKRKCAKNMSPVTRARLVQQLQDESKINDSLPAESTSF